MFHICNDCCHKNDCEYCQIKFKNGSNGFCDNLCYKKEQEQRFMQEVINYFKNL